MSARYLYVTCPACGKTEMVYIGNVELEHFDISEEFISVLCDECRMGAKEGRTE